MTESRPPVPEPMKRNVRQRCGFGCVICGDPFYDVDHIIDYHIVKEHSETNLTLLCHPHHDDKTQNRLSLIQVQEANADPVNLKAGRTAPSILNFFKGSSVVRLGNNWITNENESTVTAVAIDELPLLSFRRESNVLLLSMLLLDGNNDPVLIIDQNELVMSTQPWDIEVVSNEIKIRVGSRRIWAHFKIVPPNEIHVLRATFYRNGIHLRVRPEEVRILNGSTPFIFSGSGMDGRVAFALGRSTTFPAAGIRLRDIDREPYSVTFMSEGGAP